MIKPSKSLLQRLPIYGSVYFHQEVIIGTARFGSQLKEDLLNLILQLPSYPWKMNKEFCTTTYGELP
jgi:hypothetical protein